jgi:UDP-2,3-diacylglucosamine pyrophosphatase LpxH
MKPYPLNPFIDQSVRRYRTIFLSDFHIGAKSFDAAALLDFLKSTESDSLYLVGDIIDGWKLAKRWHWHDDITAVLDELVRKGREGTKIYYLPGNHDETVRSLPLLRRMRFARRMGITVKNKLHHTLADGRKMLVLHGDQFDRAMIGGPVSRWSDWIYDRFLDLIGGHSHMTIVIDGKVKPFSLAKFIGKQGQKALHFINNFEQEIFREARREHVDGIICGHTHIPALKHIRDIVYANCGSWLRTGHTALVEDVAGNLELLDWPSHRHTEAPTLPFSFMVQSGVRIIPDAYAGREVTQRLIASIRRTWPVTKQAEITGATGIEQTASPIIRSILNGPAPYQVILQTLEGNKGVSDKEGRDVLA